MLVKKDLKSLFHLKFKATVCIEAPGHTRSHLSSCYQRVCVSSPHWQHSGATSSAGEGNSRRASLEDLVKPFWKIKAFFTVKKETVLSHTSELDTPALIWLSSAERTLTALSAHFLSKIIILHMLRRNMDKKRHQLAVDTNAH